MHRLLGAISLVFLLGRKKNRENINTDTLEHYIVTLLIYVLLLIFSMVRVKKLKEKEEEKEEEENE